jgi:hypothetical protein
MIHVEKTNEGYVLDDFRGAGPTIAARDLRGTFRRRAEGNPKRVWGLRWRYDQSCARSQRKRERHNLSSRTDGFLAHILVTIHPTRIG